ncbi:uncharacterized protein [Elaeis guineensis]|uniref:Uncharacterized protein LOC109505980 isoform X2 n=1 Tax=Elaeis guineensis var. tenera TaxID=51953 RepID=A0A6J0PJT5_ELAGV|nr:uncharacterized protein LOC109505980 isoform X2 [Elaeis guineensis]
MGSISLKLMVAFFAELLLFKEIPLQRRRVLALEKWQEVEKTHLLTVQLVILHKQRSEKLSIWLKPAIAICMTQQLEFLQGSPKGT